jgi:aspartate aminotransferase-like enzyme
VKSRLLTPGPTQVPENVFTAMVNALWHPRSAEFSELLQAVSRQLAALFRTEHEVLTLTCSGTGAMEAAVVNFLHHGDKVITVDGGKFGERWAELAAIYGVEAVTLQVPWGETASAEQLTMLLRQHPDATAVFLTHSETSTGVAFDIAALAAAAHQASEALVIVDGISSIGVLPFYTDDWGVDVCVSGSQKGTMTPPGLAFVTASDRAWRKAETSNLPKFYLDLRKARDGLVAGFTAWTPAVTLIAGLHEALNTIFAEGLENRWAKSATLARAIRAATAAIGLQLYAKSPGDAVTAVSVPSTIDGRKLVERLRTGYGVRVADGQDRLKGKIFRVAHMGDIDQLDTVGFASAMELALCDCGWQFELGAAVSAVQRVYAQTVRGEGKRS